MILKLFRKTLSSGRCLCRLYSHCGAIPAARVLRRVGVPDTVTGRFDMISLHLSAGLPAPARRKEGRRGVRPGAFRPVFQGHGPLAARDGGRRFERAQEGAQDDRDLLRPDDRRERGDRSRRPRRGSKWCFGATCSQNPKRGGPTNYRALPLRPGGSAGCKQPLDGKGYT